MQISVLPAVRHSWLRSALRRGASIAVQSGARLPPWIKRRLRKSRLICRIRNWCSPHTNSATSQPPAPLCVLPWLHVHVGTNAAVHLCCISLAPEDSLGNIRDQSVSEIFRSKRYEAVRRQMLAGEWPAECRGCREREDLGLRSFRHASNQFYPDYVRQLVSNPAALVPVIRSTDLRLNNVCNFKCRSCGSMASNSWFNDHKLIYPEFPISRSSYGIEGFESFWSEFDRDILPNLEELYLAGGEPLVTQGHYRLLEKLLAGGKNNIRVTITTNLSELRFMHWDAIDVWRPFPNLVVNMSLDGIGAQGEYIRSGLKYADWVSNARRVKRELPHAKRILHFVVSILNVTDLRQHYEEIIRNGSDPQWITFTFLSTPEYLSIQVLTPELKAIVERDIGMWLSEATDMPEYLRVQIQALLQFMKQRDGYSVYGSEFAFKTKLLDESRGEQASALFPKLRSMLVT